MAGKARGSFGLKVALQLGQGGLVGVRRLNVRTTMSDFALAVTGLQHHL